MSNDADIACCISVLDIVPNLGEGEKTRDVGPLTDLSFVGKLVLETASEHQSSDGKEDLSLSNLPNQEASQDPRSTVGKSKRESSRFPELGTSRW